MQRATISKKYSKGYDCPSYMKAMKDHNRHNLKEEKYLQRLKTTDIVGKQNETTTSSSLVEYILIIT